MTAPSAIAIAIVDDDESVRMALGRLLRSLDLGVELYASGPELLATPTLEDLTCIVTDIRMPGFSGFDLCAALRARGLVTPIIFMTAYKQDGDEQRAIAAGATCFLQKPFTEADLLRCIEHSTKG